MIVVDTNVVVYGLIPARHPAENAQANAAFLRDPEWCAPLLWRSEFRSLLATHVRVGGMVPADAASCWAEAVALLSPRERAVDGAAVLALAVRSGCTAYDCEFVALARSLGIPLVTADRRIVKAFPNVAVSLANFARGDS